MMKQINNGIVADIGGTNARLGMTCGLNTPVDAVRTYACRDYPDFETLVRHYLSDTDQVMPAHGCLAIAGPVTDNQADLTNGQWGVDGYRIRDVFAMETCEIVNDFTALAWALPWLDRASLLALGADDSPEGDTRLVLGPGTGLGVSALIEQDRTRIAIDSEGGHIGFAPVDDVEIALLGWFRRRYERVSAERILSGRGLEQLHQALGEISGKRNEQADARLIVDGAVADPGSEYAATIALFLGIMGSVAGDLALAIGAHRVYLGGGILPRLTGLLHASAFRQRFEAKGRFQAHLRMVPTSLITAATPALTGAAARMFDARIAGSPFPSGS